MPPEVRCFEYVFGVQSYLLTFGVWKGKLHVLMGYGYCISLEGPIIDSVLGVRSLTLRSPRSPEVFLNIFIVSNFFLKKKHQKMKKNKKLYKKLEKNLRKFTLKS